MIFSIVVPMFNSEKYIRECIESVIIQTEEDFELILVDDGSTDSSINIANEYAENDTRIKIFKQKNSGSFHTRIKGVDNASGEYIVFLDADDLLKKHSLEKLKEHILCCHSDIIIFRAEVFNDNGVIKETEKIFENHKFFENENKNILYEELIIGSKMNTLWNKAIKKKCFNNELVRNYPRISMGDDILYTLEPITNAKKIEYIDDVLYNYRIVNSSLTREFQENVFEGFKFLTLKKREYLKKWHMDNKIYSEAIDNRFLNNIGGIALYSQASIKEKREIFLKVLNTIRTDNLFNEIYESSYSNLSFLRKIPIFLVEKNKFSILLFLKPLLLNARRLKYK